MFSYLTALIWPVGMAIVLGAAFLASRGSRVIHLTNAGRETGYPDDAAVNPNPNRAAGRHHSRRAASESSSAEGIAGSAVLVVVAVAGTVATFGLICLLGLLVVHQGPAIDKPVFHWIDSHQVHAVAAAMNRLTKIGDTWTVWGAAAAAAVCIAVASRDRRWLAPVCLISLIVVDHYTTLALRHVFHRVGPPTSPLGTYPSGGCDRVIVFYGLIAYLLWRELSGKRSTAIWAAAAVVALGFNEAFSRIYLSKHWLTDALSGLIYGALLLAGYVLAIRAASRAAPARADSPQPAVPLGMSAAQGKRPPAGPESSRPTAGPEGPRPAAGPEGPRPTAGPKGLVT
ncbi:MAG TPA: phosphatase PAP2 family protein [Streptosporangiaceae bacterium]|nr:phosphatase PAP2 family protein [Streptosporangiaceae bacterium]